MSNTNFLIPPGYTKPAVKSLPQASFNALVARTGYFAPGDNPILAVAGYIFAARMVGSGGLTVAQKLARHNKATLTVESGVTWDSAADSVTFTANSKVVKTSEVQLPGASFKGIAPATLDIGIFGFAETVVSTFTKFFSLRTQQDQDSVDYTFTPSDGDQIGFELQDDALNLTINKEVVYSIPLTFTIEIDAGNVVDSTVDGDDNQIGVPYSAGTVLNVDSSPDAQDLLLHITNSLDGVQEDFTWRVVPYLVGADVSATVEVGNGYTSNIVDHLTGGSPLDNPSTFRSAVTKGIMPAGMSLANNILSGTPTVDGNYNVVVTVNDFSGQTTEVRYSFTITPKVNVTIDPPKAEQNKPFNYKPDLPAGFEGVVLNTDLPAGLVLNPSTGLFSGTPTADAGTYTVSATVTVSGHTEDVSFDIVVYAPVEVRASVDGGAYELLSTNIELNAKKGQKVALAITGGSNAYLVSASNGAQVDLNNVVMLLNSGITILTVIDASTNNQLSFTLVVSSQDAILGFAITPPPASAARRNRPLLTENNRSLQVGFGGWNVRDFSTSQLLKLNAKSKENFLVVGEGTPFALFTSQTTDSKLVMPRARKFISEITVNTSMLTALGDIHFGLGNVGESGLKYEVVITTVNSVRMVELRQNGNLVAGSRNAITLGQVIGFAVLDSGIGLYVDTALSSTLIGATDADSLEFIIWSQSAGVALGGQTMNLTYSIQTEGEASVVGSIHPQTGLYTPGAQNTTRVRVRGSLDGTEVFYEVDIVVVRGSVLTSFRQATLQNRTLKVFIGDLERGDNDPLRFTSDGQPDANQIRNAIYIGKLMASGKMAPTEKRNDFSNDAEIYETAYTLQKYTLTGDILQVLNPEIVKTVVPFIRVFDDQIGTLSFGQYNQGCIPFKRVIFVWKSTVCADDTVWDSIEFQRCKSFTPFDWEIGTEVATKLPMSIESYPDEDTGLIWRFYRYDSQFVQIG